MTKIIYDQDTLKKMSLFEQITRANLKDFFDDPVQERLVFIVQPAQLWRALGKNSINIKKLEKAFNRKIKIVEYSSNKIQFIKNMVHPLKVSDVTEDDEGVIIIRHSDPKIKGLLIGRNAKNLRNLEENLRRYFEIKEIKVE